MTLKVRTILSLCLVIVLIFSTFSLAVMANSYEASSTLMGQNYAEAVTIGNDIQVEGRGRDTQSRVRDRRNLPGDVYLESIEISEPIPIEEFLASTAANYIDSEFRAMLEASIGVRELVAGVYLIPGSGVTFIPANEMDAETLSEVEANFEAAQFSQDVSMEAFDNQFIDDLYDADFEARSIANVRLSNLRSTSHHPPFEINTPIRFNFNVANNGPAVHNARFDIHLTNANGSGFLGSLIWTVPQNHNGPSGAPFELRISPNGTGGNQTISVTAGSSSVHQTFRWDSLYMSDLRRQPGAPRDNMFQAHVTNVGPGHSGVFYIDIFVDRVFMGFLRNNGIPANHIFLVTWSIAGMNPGQREIGVQAGDAQGWPISNRVSGLFQSGTFPRPSSPGAAGWVLPNNNLTRVMNGWGVVHGAYTHIGVDLVLPLANGNIVNPVGQPLFPVFNGEIYRMGLGNIEGYFIIYEINQLHHETGVRPAIIYMHLREHPQVANASLHAGMAISRGATLLGRVGNTGNAQSLHGHLHFEIRRNGRSNWWIQSLDQTQDPLLYYPNVSFSRTAFAEVQGVPEVTIKRNHDLPHEIYIVDTALIEHVGFDAVDRWFSTVDGSDWNVLDFLYYFDISIDQYVEIMSETNANISDVRQVVEHARIAASQLMQN